MEGKGVVLGSWLSLRRDGVDLETAGAGIGDGIVKVDGDEDAVRDGVGHSGTLLKGDEGVIGARHDDVEALGLEELAGPEADIEREVFFIAEYADGAAVVAAMAGVEHHCVYGAQAVDELRAEAGLDDLCEVKAGDGELVALGGYGKAEPLVDAINDRQPIVEGELDLVPAVIEKKLPGKRCGWARGEHLADGRDIAREAVKTSEALDGNVVAAVMAEDIPIARVGGGLREHQGGRHRDKRESGPAG